MSDLIAAQVSFLKRPAEDSASIIREIKKIKAAEIRPVFKKTSNEEQYKATAKVLNSMEDAKFNLEGGNLEAAKSAVDQQVRSWCLLRLRGKLVTGERVVRLISKLTLEENRRSND